MLPLETLAIMGGGAVLPYLAEAMLAWVRVRRPRKDGADAPRWSVRYGRR